jgi:hypothetical protein
MERSSNTNKEISTAAASKAGNKYLPGRLLIDKPLRVVSAHIYQNQIYCVVEWEENADGYKPQNSEILSSDLRSKCPYVLLEYYEAKVYTKNRVRLE